MRYRTYIIARDYGFAPNPFGIHCSLATCKPEIRKHSKVGDWVFGTGSSKKGMAGKLIYAMEVSEKIDFHTYWRDPLYEYKKPILNGSLKQMYGDNIYHKDEHTDKWNQLNSHHSNEDGTINELNLITDLKGEFVLISNHFYYFGSSCITIPSEFKNEMCMKRQGYKHVNPFIAQKFLNWLQENYEPGRHDEPLLFQTFERYKGR
ncbi:MAG: hypothetical protein WD037_05630 [Balneolales bacterium]